MRVIGLDLGTKTLGIALSDPLGIIATGVETFRFDENDYEMAINRVQYYLNLHQIKTIVIGLPLHMNGDVGTKANEILAFKQKLEEKFHLPVVTIDERWTTKLATNRLLQADMSREKRKKVIDKMAAVVILQNYLDSKK